MNGNDKIALHETEMRSTNITTFDYSHYQYGNCTHF